MIKAVKTSDGVKLKDTKTGKLAGSVPKKPKVPTVAKKAPTKKVSPAYPKWNLARDGEPYDCQLTRELEPKDAREKRFTAEEIERIRPYLMKQPEAKAPIVSLTDITDATLKRQRTSDGDKGWMYGPAATSADGKTWIRIHHTRILPGESYYEWECIRDDGDFPISIASTLSFGKTLEGVEVKGKLGIQDVSESEHVFWIRVLVGQTEEKERLWEWQRIKR